MASTVEGLKEWDDYVSIQPGNGLVELSGFVPKEMEALLSGKWTIADAEVNHPGPRRVRDCERLYDALVRSDIGYRVEDLHADDYQIIRTPDRIDHVGGTCLDLAVLALNQLRHAQLRPYLVMDYSPHHGTHAMVLVNLAHFWHYDGMLWPAGASSTTAGIARWRPDAEPAEEWVLYDPSESCVGGSHNFPLAQAAAWERLAIGGNETWLVDVSAGLTEAGVQERKVPMGISAGLLSRRCPPVPTIEDFPSRQGIRHRLRAIPGTTVLRGNSGVGKSLLALQAVADVTQGAGWFLNGSSAGALRTSLAELERYERGLPVGAESSDVDGFAEAALSRLNSVRGRWTVVVDNADLKVTDIQQLLPQPDRTRSQYLIITTTDATPDGKPGGWGAWADLRPDDERRLEPVEPLRLDESMIFLTGGADHARGAAIVHLTIPDTNLTPLALRAGRGLWLAGKTIEATDTMMSSDVPATFWAHLVGSISDEERSTARLVSVLPSAPIAPDLLALPNAPAHLLRLEELGLLSRSAGTWQLHRLLATAIRSDGHQDEVSSDLLNLLDRPNLDAFLRTAFDPLSITAIVDTIRTDPGTHRVGVALARVADIVEERGDMKRARDLARVALPMLPVEAHNEKAACLLVSARYVNQHLEGMLGKGDTVSDILSEAVSASQEAERLTDVDAMRLKARAMHGLLIKKQATYSPDLSADERRELLQRAESLIIETLHAREELFRDALGHLELAKARFNVGGVSIELAKAMPDRADELLSRGKSAYRDAEIARRDAFGAVAHRHIASCTAGVGTVELYQALLVAATKKEAQALLQSATSELIISLTARQTIEHGDGGDVRKSMKVLIKTLMARLMLATDGDTVLFDETLDKLGLIPEFRKESRALFDRSLLPRPKAPADNPQTP